MIRFSVISASPVSLQKRLKVAFIGGSFRWFAFAMISCKLFLPLRTPKFHERSSAGFVTPEM